MLNSLHFFILMLFLLQICAKSQCPCSVEGYIIDDDKSGTNVRDIPNGKIIKKLILKDRCELATPVIIHKSDNYWCYITTDDECVEKINGWVSSKLIYTSLKFTSNYNKVTEKVYTPPIKVYQKSELSSKIVGYFSSSQDVNILKCCGGWVFVKGKKKNGELIIGWIRSEDQCSNPFTICN